MAKAKITFTDEMGQEYNLENQENNANVPQTGKKKKSKVLLFVMVMFVSLVMGITGTIGSLLYLSAHPDLQKKLGLVSLSNPFTSTEKLVLEESSAITDAVNKVTSAVVSISVNGNATDMFGRTYETTGGGTGFIITQDGLIVTNKHVVSEENAKYKVYTADGKEYDATIVAKDPAEDLAVIKIDATGLPTLELGDSDSVNIGQWVVAIGNALGEFSNSVTVGVISAKDRHITASDSLGGQSEELTGLLQTDAAINSGNSGGPLVNLKGQVIGINTAVADAQGIGFAIPINSAKKAIESIKKTGEIKRPMLGVRYVTINKELAKANNLSVDYGAWILPGTNRTDTAIVSGSPADKAGLEENDIILEIDGQKLDENNTLSSVLADCDVDQTVTLKVLHDGTEKEVKVKLVELKNNS